MSDTHSFLDVLRQLSHESFRSGEAVARHLGCSRATVHNAVQHAQDLGVAIHAVQGRGYRLGQPLSWLAPERLAPVLEPQGFRLLHFDSLASTNTFLLEEAQKDAVHRTVVVTTWQTRGRGRRGRHWQAGLGDGLTFSLLWRSGRPAAELSGLSLVVGVVLAKALQRLGVEQTRVKWPNDILVRNAKLGGVLIELTGDMLGPSAAVIGVGLNLRGGDALSQSMDQPVTDLARCVGAVDANDIFLRVLTALDKGLHRFEREGFPAFRDEWHACHAYQDMPVVVLTGHGERIAGRAAGVDEQGALLLATAAGVRRFYSGEVSLRSVET